MEPGVGEGVLSRDAAAWRAAVAGALLVCLAMPAAGAAERTYYIAADEIVWDYAPSYPVSPLTGEPFTKEESIFLRQSENRIGRKYLKAVYREYTE